MSFKSLNVIDKISDALSAMSIVNPTPIQEKVIPIILNKENVLAKAATGTGKTAAFVIPVLQIMYEEKIVQNNNPKVLVLSPNRELSTQISDNFISISKNLPFKTAIIIGGINYSKQLNMMKRGVDIIVATPGRCKDLIQQRKIDLTEIKFFILDEVDLILDMGFIDDIKYIRNQIASKFQTVLLSATIPDNIKKLANFICMDYQIVEAAKNTEKEGNINETIYIIEQFNKKFFLADLIAKSEDKSFIVFCNMKKRADELTRFLKENRVKVRSIHGDKTQSSRQEAISLFKNNQIQVLVATDIAARGIHIDNVNYVIHFDVPKNGETYIHRTGRTGRAGKDGESILLTTKQEGMFVKSILRNSANLKLGTDEKWSINISLSDLTKNAGNFKDFNSNRNSSYGGKRNFGGSSSSFDRNRRSGSNNGGRSNFSSNSNGGGRRKFNNFGNSSSNFGSSSNYSSDRKKFSDNSFEKTNKFDANSFAEKNKSSSSGSYNGRSSNRSFGNNGGYKDNHSSRNGGEFKKRENSFDSQNKKFESKYSNNRKKTYKKTDF